MKKLFLFLLCLVLSVPSIAKTDIQAGTVFPTPRPLPDFNLIDSNQRPFTHKQFEGKWTLAFFGFTRCGSICPRVMTSLKDIYANLNGYQPLPQVALISVDPERDTPEQMNKYVISFNPAFIGVTGNPVEISKLAKSMNVMYMKVKQKDDGYTVEHSGAILLINPQGKLAAIFTMPHDAKAIAKDYQTITG